MALSRTFALTLDDKYDVYLNVMAQYVWIYNLLYIDLGELIYSIYTIYIPN